VIASAGAVSRVFQGFAQGMYSFRLTVADEAGFASYGEDKWLETESFKFLSRIDFPQKKMKYF
jgi:hypothetical protein